MLRDDGVMMAIGAVAALAGASLLKGRPGRGSRAMQEGAVERLFDEGLISGDASILYWQPVLVEVEKPSEAEPTYSDETNMDAFDPRPYIEGDHAVMVTPSGAMHRVDELGQLHGVANPSVQILTQEVTSTRRPGRRFSEVQILEHLQDRFGDGERLWDAQRRPAGPAVFVDEHDQAFILDGVRLVPVTFDFIVRLG
jgi:hypothetical protein